MQRKKRQGKSSLIFSNYNVEIVAIGNGTASRESEQFIADILKEMKEDISYMIVNEAGASVYSASDIAVKNFRIFKLKREVRCRLQEDFKIHLLNLLKLILNL